MCGVCTGRVNETGKNNIATLNKASECGKWKTCKLGATPPHPPQKKTQKSLKIYFAFYCDNKQTAGKKKHAICSIS